MKILLSKILNCYFQQFKILSFYKKMRFRRSIQPKMLIPSVRDIFDLSTSNSSPTTYEVIQVDSSPETSETLIVFRLYENETNKNTWKMTINSVGEKKILGISGQYIISEFRKPPISSQNLPISSQNLPISSRNPPTSSRNPPTSSRNPPTSSRNPPTSSQNPPIPIVTIDLDQDFLQYYNWLSYFDNMLVLNLLEHPENYDRFFRFRKFDTSLQLILFHLQRKRGFPVEAIHPLGYFEFWRGSLKEGEKPLVSSSFESESSDLFSASQVSNFIDFGSRVYNAPDYTKKIKETYEEITGESLPEHYNFESPDQYVSWASYLIDFVTGYSYDEDIVTPEETDLNSVGIIIVLLSMLGEKIWEFPIKDTLTGGKTSITLGTLRFRLIPKLRNLTLLIPTGFLTDLDKILDRVFIEY